MVKVTRIRGPNFINGFRSSKVSQSIDTALHPKTLHQRSMNTQKNVMLMSVENYPIVTQSLPRTRDHRLIESNPHSTTQYKTMDHAPPDHHKSESVSSPFNAMQQSKLGYYLLIFIVLFIAGVAIAAAVVAALLSPKNTPVTMTTLCSPTLNYSDPCNGHPPTSKYIFAPQVFCRQDATNKLVLGYFFSCSNYSSCTMNSDCGQDGYCDQYCLFNSCPSFCNQNRGNCAKLATGINCGVSLTNQQIQTTREDIRIVVFSLFIIICNFIL